MFILLVCSSLAGNAQIPTKLSPVDTYNYVVGTQTIGASYQFTKETRLVETARAILAMGSNTIKLSLVAEPGMDPKPRSLAEVAERSPSAKILFQIPFMNYLMWVSPLSSPVGGAFDPRRLEAERREVYELTCYLLRTYNGTGKSFYLGNWEGDWLLTHTNPEYEPTTEEVRNMINWANTRQKAVDDARRDTTHAKVNVYYYVEVNRVWDARKGMARVVNKVLPEVNPDFVSYSSYDSQYGDIEKTYAQALDYIETQLKPKADISGKRVFIGEYGMPQMENGANAQDTLARHVMRAGLRWGCPFVLYWEMYNNEVTSDGLQRGFWLIDNQGVKQPVYQTHHGFYKKARSYVATFYSRNKRVPTRVEFGRASLQWLPVGEPIKPGGPIAQGSPFVDELTDLKKVYSYTPDLNFDSSNPDLFEGRTLRLRRGGENTPQNIIYRGNGIVRFSITAYDIGGFTGTGGAKVRVYASKDAKSWVEVPGKQEAAPTKSGWERVMLTPLKDITPPAAYLKIEMRDDPTVYSPQLGGVWLFTKGLK